MTNDTPLRGFLGDNRFLSNFSPSLVTLDEIAFPTVEHAYQAAKTFDRSLRTAMAGAPSPGDAKRMGRHLDLRRDWEDVKISVMAGLLFQKFAEESRRAMLLSTRTRPLIELNNWHDNFWGTCQCAKCGGGKKGTNHLGVLLMSVRTFYDTAERTV